MSSLCHFHNPEVMTQFFSLNGALALFYLSKNITKFSPAVQDEVTSTCHAI